MHSTILSPIDPPMCGWTDWETKCHGLQGMTWSQLKFENLCWNKKKNDRLSPTSSQLNLTLVSEREESDLKTKISFSGRDLLACVQAGSAVYMQIQAIILVTLQKSYPRGWKN